MLTKTRWISQRRLLALLPLGAIAAIEMCAASSAPAQSPEHLPFGVGEQLVYRVRIPKVKMGGRGVMSVEGPEDVRGAEAYVLRFDFKASLGPIKAANHEQSWLDPQRMAALRFQKRERHPLGSLDEAVELFPEERRWEMANGQAGDSPTDAPLDELSFIYFVRTLPLVPDTTYTFDRHFEPGRNPITVRVLAAEAITTNAGEFATVLVEMRVKDPRHYRGEGVIRINLTDDEQRLPVRIESVMPQIGSTVFTLESYTRPAVHVATPVR